MKLKRICSLLFSLSLLWSVSACRTSTDKAPPSILYGSGRSVSQDETHESNSTESVNEQKWTSEDELDEEDNTFIPMPTTGFPFAYNPSYSSFYYKKLVDNIPRNNGLINNCGYVALAMLLSFYDSFFDDTFIEEDYDQPVVISSLDDSVFSSSPGVKDSEFDLGSLTSNDELDYPKYVSLKISQNDFLGKLYQIGIESGAMNDSRHTTLNFEQLLLLVRGYFNAYPELNNKVITQSAQLGERVDGLYVGNSNFTGLITSVILRRIIIDKISQGNPVIVGGNISESAGHIAIAYEYDPINDIIYGHDGFKSEELTHINLDEEFAGGIKDAIWIIPRNSDEFEHFHSFNYSLINFQTFNLSSSLACSCEFVSHQCQSEYCSACGCLCPSTLSSHNYGNVYACLGRIGHKRQCTKCLRYSTIESHVYFPGNMQSCDCCGYLGWDMFSIN